MTLLGCFADLEDTGDKSVPKSSLLLSWGCWAMCHPFHGTGTDGLWWVMGVQREMIATAPWSHSWLQMWHFLCALQVYSSMPSRVQVSSYNGTCRWVTAQLSPWQSGYKATARAAWCLWYPRCWLVHERWDYMLSQTGTLVVLGGFSSHWPGRVTVQSCGNILTLLKPSLKTSFPLLQVQEEHKCLSLVLEQHEGHCPPRCNCFICWQAVPPWCINALVKPLQIELVSPNAGRLRGRQDVGAEQHLQRWAHRVTALFSHIVQINILNLIEAASLVEGSFKCKHPHLQLKQSLDSWMVSLG